MAILKIEVCEVCHELGKPVHRYRVGDEDHLVRMPLCEDDASALVSLLDLKRPQRRKTNVPMTMEEVKARKTGTRKPRPAVKRTR